MKADKCRVCRGTGNRLTAPKVVTECGYCHGTGLLEMKYVIWPGGNGQMRIGCAESDISPPSDRVRLVILIDIPVEKLPAGAEEKMKRIDELADCLRGVHYFIEGEKNV